MNDCAPLCQDQRDDATFDAPAHPRVHSENDNCRTGGSNPSPSAPIFSDALAPDCDYSVLIEGRVGPDLSKFTKEELSKIRIVRVGQANYAIVDEADFQRVTWNTWFKRSGSSKKSTIYAASRVKFGSRDYIAMHTLIMGYGGVDHRNHDGLDNRRSNLRMASASQQCANRRKPNISRSRSTSKYKGVSLNRGQYPFAQINDGGKKKVIGYFKTEEEAARAYDKAAIERFGEFACLNFPLEHVATPPDRKTISSSISS